MVIVMRFMRTKNSLFFVFYLALFYCVIFSTQRAFAYISANFDLSCNTTYPDGSPWEQTNLQITPTTNTLQVASLKSCVLTLTTFKDDSANIYVPGIPGDYMTINLLSTGSTASASTLKRYVSGSFEAYFSAIATSYNTKILVPTITVSPSPFQLSVWRWDNGTNNTSPVVLSAQVDTSTSLFTANGSYEGAAGLCKYYVGTSLPNSYSSARNTYQAGGTSCGTYSASSLSWSLTQSLSGLSGVGLFVIVAGECNGSDQCGFTVFDLSGY